MKWLLLLILAFPVCAFGEPFIVSDNTTEPVVSCEFSGITTIPCTILRNHISVDAANPALVSGTYTVKALWCVVEGTVKWCSDWSVPFTFTKPKVPVSPVIKVQSQK